MLPADADTSHKRVDARQSPYEYHSYALPSVSSGVETPKTGARSAGDVDVRVRELEVRAGAGGRLEDSENEVGISWTPAEFKEGDHEPEDDAHGYQYDQASG